MGLVANQNSDFWVFWDTLIPISDLSQSSSTSKGKWWLWFKVAHLTVLLGFLALRREIANTNIQFAILQVVWKIWRWERQMIESTSNRVSSARGPILQKSAFSTTKEGPASRRWWESQEEGEKNETDCLIGGLQICGLKFSQKALSLRRWKSWNRLSRRRGQTEF